MPSEYEDKYLLLRDENTALKKKKNEQEATIKRMFTKLAMIEEKLTKTRQTKARNNQDDPETGGNRAAAQVPVRRDLDTEKFINALKSENAVLRKKNQALMEKNRWLEEQGRQSSSLKRLGAVATTRPTTQKRPAARNTDTSSGGFAGSTLEKQTDNARRLHRDMFSGELEVALKKRLVVAEKQLMKLQKENEQLRASSSGLQLKPRRDNNEDSGPSDEENDDTDADSKEPTNLELGQMKRELRDRQAQLAILNARYENLESNALAEREIQEKTLDQMEQMNRQVHKLRTQLQDAIMEKEELEIRIMKAGDQEKDIVLLREQNRRLEDRMTSLCESPFINDAFQRKERIDKLFDLEKLTQEQKATIAHMTDENQKLQAAVREMQESIKQLKHAKDRVEQDLEQMAHHLVEERNARSVEAIKSSIGRVPAPRPEPLIIVRPRTPEVQHQAPEKRDACSSPVNNNASPAKSSTPSVSMAGGIVTRRYGDLPPTSSFLDETRTEDDYSVKHLRNRVHVLQIAHLKSMQELERCEKMLQAQTNINRELALEIEELTTSKISSTKQLQRRMKELELLCEERQQRIHTLQAEIKQLKYAREKLLFKARDDDDVYSDNSGSDDEDSEVASLSESLILAARDLAPGDQLLELGIVGANFDSNVVGINSSTFVLCDFFDFESQSTPLLMGSRPEYNLSATFKVTVDGFFLRYLASEAIVLEVHQAIRGDFKLIGKASIRLAKLLQSKGVLKEPLLAVKSVNCSNESGATVIGTLNVVLRLSTPISEIWQVHLRSYPQDSQLLSAAAKRSDFEAPIEALCGEGGIDDVDHLTNELQITVFGCRNLRSYGKRSDSSISRLPSSYAHYQLLGFPDVFTNIVPELTSPEYDLSCSRQAFVLAVDACLLRFLSKFRFWVTVFDDQVELDEGAQEDGMVGRCGLSLSDLVSGETIRGWFPLKDQNENHTGEVSVLIQWKDPFQVLQLTSSQRTRGINGRPIDMHSLDFDQQHALLAIFSSDMDGRVNYQQFLHYASPSEELELLVAKLKERFENAIDSELVASIQDALTTGVDAKQRKRMLLPVHLLTQAVEKYGIYLSDAERELLQTAFGTTRIPTGSNSSMRAVSGATVGAEPLITLNYLMLHINPRLSCGERLLCHKIRQTFRGYVQEQKKRKATDAVPAVKLFEKFDAAKCGRITRSAFRKCLSILGFDLMNVESEYRELVRNHMKQSDNTQTDLVAIDAPLPFQAGVDLDEDVLIDIAGSQPSQQLKQMNCDRNKKNMSSVNPSVEPIRDIPELRDTSQPASTEFQRRKKAFMDRMKAIASVSSKNLVYEQMEKKLQDQRLQETKQQTTPLSRYEIPQDNQRLQEKKQQMTLLSRPGIPLHDQRLQEKQKQTPLMSRQDHLQHDHRLQEKKKQTTLMSRQDLLQHNYRLQEMKQQTTPLSRQDLSQHDASSRVNWREATIASKKEKKVTSDAAQAKEKTRTHGTSTASVVSDTQYLPPRSPIALLADFLDWCDEHGVDLRGELEVHDSHYEGFVSAMELKQTLLRLGITKMSPPSSVDGAIGQLVRQFRNPERTDAVFYIQMLLHAVKPDWADSELRCYDQISEHLRSRIRSKANLKGKIDHSDAANYANLDAAFSHFDQEQTGFLTAESLRSGLRALSYQPTPQQLGLLMTQMRIFRHDGGGLSRTEFDSFVLDPYGFRSLKKLSEQLYSDVGPQRQDKMPRVAYLSRLLMMECGENRDTSSLPKTTFWTQLERALERRVTDWEKLRLQHLFDVSRNGQIAYKLFLKVISQWRAPVSVTESVLAGDKEEEKRSASKPEKQQAKQTNQKPPCTCDAILRSLYNQMSSIDFDSQVDIVEEYLRLKDCKHTGSIKMKQLKRVFDQIGLSLSADAFTSLILYFPGSASSSAEEQGELVAYEKLLLALVALHKQSHDSK